MDRRLRRALRYIDRTIGRESLRRGQQVLWYEFDATSVSDAEDIDLYDEGGSQLGEGASRKWGSAVPIQTYQAILDEGAQQFLPEGAYTVDTLRLIISYAEMNAAGISNPLDRGAHIHDRVEYDGRLWSVDSYNPRGRTADRSLTVTVICTQVMEDEQVLDDATWHA